MKKQLQKRLQPSLLLFFFLAAGTLSARSSDSTIFRDDFNRSSLGTFWQATPGWTILNNAAYSFIDGAGGKLRTSEGYNDSSYVIETQAKGFTDNYMREFRITFGQGNLSNDSMYVLSYKPYEGGRLTLSLSADNIYFAKPLDEVIIYPDLKTDQSYAFKIARYKSGLIQIYLDQGEGYGTIPLLETIDSTYGKAGHIGWETDTQSYAEDFFVDWITAYKPSEDKAGIREKPHEDDLITQVSAKNGKPYTVNKLKIGMKDYTDREYTVTSLPSYLNYASFIQTSMDDKNNTLDSFLTFFIKKDAIVYIAYDSRATAIPSWLNDWTKTGDHIGTTDSRLPFLDVYSKVVQAGEGSPYLFLLGGNLANPASGAEANYFVAAIELPEILPLQAEDAFLSGAVIASDHAGYLGTGFADYQNPSNDFVEWTVKIDVPGTYNLGFRYSNGGLTDRPLQISNDEANIGALSFSPTSSWSTWSFLNGSNVFLTKGVHKIRATSTGDSGPNIDQLSLYYNSSSAAVISAKKIPHSPAIVNTLPEQSPHVYPNPFAQTTNLYYTVKEKANVLISVCNMQGQQVQLLESGIKEAGMYKTAFDAGKLLAGMYFYRLQIGNTVKTGKLVKQ